MLLNVTQSRGLAIGDRVGKYRITDKIGQGGMGEVFGAVHDGLGRDVAIKLLRARFADDESLLARFWQEAEAVSRIGHSNIVSVYDFGRTEAGESYYVMERIAGESLAARLRRQPPLSRGETDAIFAQLCRALVAVHARGIIHRDLKPDNVLLQTQDGGLPHVKVVDFGVAKVRATPLGATPGNLTAAGTLLGTPAYMAPEQIMAAQHVDGRADVYSLGAMLYQVLTGAPPFTGEELAVLMAHVRDEVPAPSTKRPQSLPAIAPALDAFVLRALAKEPAQRPDALAFATELHALLATAPAATTTGAPKRPRSSAVLVAGGIVVAATAALAWRALRNTTPTNISPPAVAAPKLTSAQRGQQLMDAALAGEPVDRRAALHAIGTLATRHGLDAVTRALGDGEPEVRRAAAEAALAIGRPSDGALRAALAQATEASGGSLALDIAVARAVLGDDAVAPELTRARRLPDPSAHLKATWALTALGTLPPSELQAALAAAPAARPALRWPAYATWYRLGSESARAALVAALPLDRADDRAALDAAVTLAAAGDARGRAALVTLARVDAADVRQEAEAQLAEAGDAAARDLVVLRLGGRDVAARQRAALALARLALRAGDGGAFAALARALDDDDRVVRLTAAAAFWSAS